MPAIGFKYPDGEHISFEDVFENGKLELERMGIVISPEPNPKKPLIKPEKRITKTIKR